MFTQLGFLTFNVVKSVRNWPLASQNFLFFPGFDSQEVAGMGVSQPFRGLPPAPIRPALGLYCCCVFPPPFCGPLSKPSRRPRRDVGKCVWAGDAPSASDMIAIKVSTKANNRLSQRPWQLSPWPLFCVRFNTSSCFVFFLFVVVNPFIPNILCNCNHSLA